jgi:2-C-methyl-D-erythritol 4-phosphate cytidylyltransferase / 2-C-methyl-D-erythritol 2,4-cyclodiphosphate synthase
MEKLWIIIVAGGGGTRLGGDTPKQYLPLAGKPLLAHCLEAFAEQVPLERIVLVIPAGDEDRVTALLPELPGVSPHLVTGGSTRQASVAAGLAAIPAAEGFVAIHDAARPFFDAAILPSWVETLAAAGGEAGLLPVLPVTDTLLELNEGRAVGVGERESLARAQTPQLFPLPLIRAAHAAAAERGELGAGDDASLLIASGKEVIVVTGDPRNSKVTTAADFRAAERALGDPPRSGIGYDSHRFDPDRPLILGGVTVPSKPGGLAGHSDADVLSHAIMDALLGAAALGDIGRHFPDTDPAHAGADSLVLLVKVRELLAECGLAPAQVDATIIAEAPKLAPHIDAMRGKLAAALSLSEDRVSIKATTNEGMGAIGRGEGIAAQALVVLKEIR